MGTESVSGHDMLTVTADVAADGDAGGLPRMPAEVLLGAVRAVGESAWRSLSAKAWISLEGHDDADKEEKRAPLLLAWSEPGLLQALQHCGRWRNFVTTRDDVVVVVGVVEKEIIGKHEGGIVTIRVTQLDDPSSDCCLSGMTASRNFSRGSSQRR